MLLRKNYKIAGLILILTALAALFCVGHFIPVGHQNFLADKCRYFSGRYRIIFGSQLGDGNYRDYKNKGALSPGTFNQGLCYSTQEEIDQSLYLW